MPIRRNTNCSAGWYIIRNDKFQPKARGYEFRGGILMSTVKRNEKLAFYGVKGENDAVTYHRMKGFTEMSGAKNPIEYARRYVDEPFEQSDVVGYSPSFTYGFDQHKGNEVHNDIIKIHNDELVLDEAVREIIFVDLTSGDETAGYAAAKREFVVIADTEGGSVDAYTYTGSLKVKGERISGKAKSSDNWMTCTFEEE